MNDFPSITAYLSWDHDRLDALLATALRLVQEGSLPDAREELATFMSGLKRHMRLEEDVLFSVFEQHTGLMNGPTQVMRMEHRAIEHALVRMSSALEVSDVAAFATAHGDLLEVLGPHNEKEEQILYPMADHALDDGERHELTGRLQHS